MLSFDALAAKGHIRRGGIAVFGVILFWRVWPEGLAEHAEIMREALPIEHERCPELLLNLPFGPAADGTFAAVQLFAEEAAYLALPERVRREEPRLWHLWERTGELSDPSAARAYRFEAMTFLDVSLARALVIAYGAAGEEG
jgi:hypothetical protein